MASPANQVIEELAAGQCGLVTRAQLLKRGLTIDMVAARVRSGRLRPVHRGVYQVGPFGLPHSKEMAAVLACGPEAVLSHVSAAAFWKMVPDHVDSERVEVTIRGRDRGRRPGIRVHRCRIEPDEIAQIENIPVTNAARTLLDLAGRFSARDLEQALARAERQNVIARPELLSLLVRYPGRPGAPALRAMAEVDAQPALTRSTAEDRFLALVRKAQLPVPESNVKLGDHEVDFYWRRERLVVEVDGFAFHSSRRMFENDRRRDAGLTAKGLRIIRVTWRQIVNEPEVVLVRVAQALVR